MLRIQFVKFSLFSFLLLTMSYFVFDFVSMAEEVTDQQVNETFVLADITAVSVEVNDIAFDPNTNRLFGSASGYVPDYGDSIFSIDISTGEPENPIFVGGYPGRFEISDDGSYLYVGLIVLEEVRRVNLISETVDLSFELGIESNSNGCGVVFVHDMVLVENDPDVVVITHHLEGCSPGNRGVAVYDNGVMRPNVLPYNDLFVTDAIEPSGVITKLYGYTQVSSGHGFRHVIITDEGLHRENEADGLISGWDTDIEYHQGLIYAGDGGVIDPSDNTLIGTFNSSGPFTINSNDEHILFARSTSDDELFLDIFELDTFYPLASIPIPDIDNLPKKLVYLTPNHVALLTEARELYIIELLPLGQTTYLPIMQNSYCLTPYTTYVDDFSDPNSGWPILDTGNTIYQYNSGEYNIYHRERNRWAGVTRGDSWQFGDRFGGSGRIIGDRGSWGMIFGLNGNWSDFYTFELLPQDQIWVILHFNSTSGWQIVQSGVNSNIQQGSVFNELTISSQNITNLMHLQINGNTITTLPERPGRIGWTGTSFIKDTDIRFDDYTFVKQNCAPASQATYDMAIESTAIKERPPLELLLPNLED